MASTGGTTNFANMPLELFLKVMEERFRVEAAKQTDLIARFCDQKSTDLYQETARAIPGLGEFGEWDMESSTGVEKLRTGREVSITQTGFRKQVGYTFKMKQYLQYRQLIVDLTDKLTRSGFRTMNSQGMAYFRGHLLNTGDYWTATPGNEYLFGAHTLLNGASHTNRTTSAVTSNTLQTAIGNILTTPDEDGEEMFADERSFELWVPTVDFLRTKRLLNIGIPYESGSANYTANVLDREVNVSVLTCGNYLSTGEAILKLPASKMQYISRVSISLTNRQYLRDSDEATIHSAKFARAVGAWDWRGGYAFTGTA